MLGAVVEVAGGVAAFSALATLVSVLVEILKPLYAKLEEILDAREVPVEIDIVVSMVVGIVLAFGAKVNIFEVLEIPFAWAPVAYAITGFLLSKGSNFAHGLFERFQK